MFLLFVCCAFNFHILDHCKIYISVFITTLLQTFLFYRWLVFFFSSSLSTAVFLYKNFCIIFICFCSATKWVYLMSFSIFNYFLAVFLYNFFYFIETLKIVLKTGFWTLHIRLNHFLKPVFSTDNFYNLFLVLNHCGLNECHSVIVSMTIYCF